jgi:hypothetical protein
MSYIVHKIMAAEQKDTKEEILKKAKNFFQDTIAPNHINNLEKLTSLKKFKYNPFLLNYLAAFLSGKANAKSMAKALIYPRILGTSITTSFGQNAQLFISEVLQGFGSAIIGIDIEFIDQIDGRKKYCQVKSGPDTINKDDVDTIKNHFTGIKNKARTDNLGLQYDDLIVGVLYGEPDELSAHYKKLAEEHPVIVGKEFWHRLTGDEDFYLDLIDTFGEVAEEVDARENLEKVINELAENIKIEIFDGKDPQ